MEEPDGLDVAGGAGKNFLGDGEEYELDTLFVGVAAFFEAAGHFCFTAAVDAVDGGSAEADGGAGTIHSSIAAADDDDVVGCERALAESIGESVSSEIGADEEFRGAVDTGKVFARDLE